MKKLLSLLTCIATLTATAQNVIQIRPLANYVQIPDNNAFHFTTTVTYEAKVYVCADSASFVNEQVVAINCISPDQWGFFIGIAPGRKARAACCIGVNTYKCDAPDAIPNDGQFHTITGTRSGNTLMVYVDGVLKNSVTVSTGNLRNTSGVNRIGIAQTAVPQGRTYLLKDVRFWNTARTQQEISDNLNTTLTGNEAGLVGLYTFNQSASTGSGVTVTNSATATGSAADGVTMGNPTTPIIGQVSTFADCTVEETCNGYDDDDDAKVDEVCQPVIHVVPWTIIEGSSGFTYYHIAAVLNLSHAYDSAVTVKYRTKDKTAAADSDYLAAEDKIKFRPGETQKTIFIYIAEDTLTEAPHEKFFIQFHDVTGATIDMDKAGIVIKDDDLPGLLSAKTNPVITEPGIKLAPNPVKDQLMVSGIAGEAGIVFIVDMQGKIVQKQTVSSHTFTMNISALKKGMYLFAYSNGKEQKQIKFIKD